MCHSSLCFLDFVIMLNANAGEEAQVIPIEDVDKNVFTRKLLVEEYLSWCTY
jgi:hypothetical protein